MLYYLVRHRDVGLTFRSDDQRMRGFSDSDWAVRHSTSGAVFMDNQAGRDLAYNPQHHPRTKHIARRHFFIREKVEDHTLVVPFVRTVDNLADFFTKPLGAKAFFPMRDAIMNVRG